jgi:hypothetical protein
MLASVLGSNPQVSGFSGTGAPEDEGQHLQTVLPTDEHHGGPGRFAFSPAAHLTEASPYAAPEPARRLREQWDRYWDHSRPVLLEKSPPNLIRFRLLQRVFPGSAFILVMRNPVPVVLSTRKWSPAVTHRALVQHWLYAHEIAFADSSCLASFMAVRYEDLISEPAAVMTRVASFIGVPAQFDLTGVDRTVNDRYFRQWAAEIADGELGDLEPAVRHYGYSLEVRRVTDAAGARDRRAAAI